MSAPEDRVAQALREIAEFGAAEAWEFSPADARREARRRPVAVFAAHLGATSNASRARQPGVWSHRVMVVAVAAVILAVFFVPLPHVSLFRRLVTPAKPSTSTSVPIIVPNRATPCTTTVHGVTQGPHGLIELPVDPGRIISRSRATEVAAGYGNGSTAKLTSWTEVSMLFTAGGTAAHGWNPPKTLTDAPWAPLWAVEIRSTSQASRPDVVALVAARSAVVDYRIPAGHWFAALSDRDPTLKGCPGGTTARLPFGVLTRDEEAFVVAKSTGIVAGRGRSSAILKLTTIRALDKANPDLFGGCVHQDCSLDELVWPWITIISAEPGETLACLPPSASYPPGYQPKQVRSYVGISLDGNSEIDCHGVPLWVTRLRDLAPPN
jgi:hypothetical protein